MPVADWGALKPDQVADWMNFERGNPNWHYEKSSQAMADRQAEGVAYLWNLLSQYNVALLADEVGMGKTFQALGIASLLWKMKPDAKVLVMAPNRDICLHWKREYQNFVRDHFREVDHCVKNSADLGPVQAIRTCWRLNDLVDAVESGSGHLYLTTIHSLSGLVYQAEEGQDKNKIAEVNAQAIHERIKAVLGQEGFDLVIIDEAHYFRNVHGGSQRVSAAKAFFGDEQSRLAGKALLLTATPSHSRLSDVNSILSYFIDLEKESDLSVAGLMNKFGLRRFRRMEGSGGHYSKRQYRNEIEMPCDFGQRPESEMFFALYQKKLVTELKHTRDNRSILYGFLEGFESVGRVNLNDSVTEAVDTDIEESTRVDFGKAPDSALLGRLTKEYYEKFGDFPDHPKYGALVEKCTPASLFDAPRDLHEDKHLVFVRRIPSVRELTQRINKAYDETLAAPIYRAWGLSDNDEAVKKWRADSWSRRSFDQMIRQLQSDESDDVDFDDATNDDEEIFEADSYLGSAIAELFVVKKGKEGRTDCSNVSLRFRKPESIFALFLEPASNYQDEGYQYYYEHSQGDKSRADYINAARDKRFSQNSLATKKTETLNPQGRVERQFNVDIKTAWMLMYPLLGDEHRKKLRDWSENRPGIAENFSNYVKAGFLFSSPVIVELYAWFTEFNRSSSTRDAQQKYQSFLDFITPKIPESLMLEYFKNALDTFETLCDKIIDHKSDEWGKDWRVLTRLENPAWYASGESDNRQRLILGFNSPFYPNVLIATSVFQEGVNLHLQCRKVHHYGIAWTPGDNEQRVGRVDRLFGKVNNLLKVNGLSELEIHYPFLRNTFDEEQVASFIAKKFDVEEKMDACVQSASNKYVEQTRIDWKEFLRKPVKNLAVKDPYEARFDELPSGQYIPFDNHPKGDIDRHAYSLLNEIIDHESEQIYRLGNTSLYPHGIFLVDPIVEYECQSRRQPILVEKLFSTEFSSLVSGTVYYIALKSPIATREDIGVNLPDLFDRLPEICHRLSTRYPLAKVSINEDLAMSHFYLNVSAELPVFVKRGHMGMLSNREIKMAYHHVKSFADELENELFYGERDLTVDHLNLINLCQEVESKREGTFHGTFTCSEESTWKKISLKDGDVEYLSAQFNGADISRMSTRESLFLKTLYLNNQFQLVKFQPDTNGCRVTICYPSDDFQLEERLLLERWFAFVSGH